jgi:microcystin-dependent protein
MSTIFPADPEINDEYQGYRYNGTSWDIIGQEYNPTVYSGTEPSNAKAGDIWIDSSTDVPSISPETILTTSVAAEVYATKTYADNAVSALVDSAPSTLNTLNELAAALGDDANFATTITNALSPVGSVTAYALATPPAGWLLCDGTVHDISSYPALGAGLGSTYGGNGTTTFAVPNLKGRMPVGLDSAQTEFDALAETGGAKTHTLTQAQMPSHTHTQNAHNHGITQSPHSHTVGADRGWFAGFGTDTSLYDIVLGRGYVGYGAMGTSGVNANISINNNTATNQNTGGGEAHNNLQPYIVMNYIIRAV